MSLRAVATSRAVEPRSLWIVPRRLRVVSTPRTLRRSLWTRFGDDRELVGVKLILLAALTLLAMAVEFRL